MAYVPGFQHDIFVSYAHGDNRGWIERFLDYLRRDIKSRLGLEPAFWLDDENLRRDRDFRREIPESVEASAIFLMLASNSYIRSKYCVAQECEAFKRAQAKHRLRFTGSDFANSQFAFSCPILRVDNNDHRTIFAGVTDIDFCDENDTFKIGSRKFDESLSRLVTGIETLLRGMRHHATPVFLYPDSPSPEVAQAHETLRNELFAEGFRILPERQTNVEGQLREASLSVFLFGGEFDERARTLTELARQQQKRWVVWRSPEAEQTSDLKQLAFTGNFEKDDSPQLTFLAGSIRPAKLKEEVFAFLRPDASANANGASGKPKIYLIYNLKDLADKQNAGSILLHYDKEFHFDLPDDLALRSARLMKSDGVLLIWGNADTEWCRSEFRAMLKARSPNRGLCLFDPQGTKAPVIEEIRQVEEKFLIAEEFGRFDPSRLEAFFDPIRRSRRGGGE